MNRQAPRGIPPPYRGSGGLNLNLPSLALSQPNDHVHRTTIISPSSGSIAGRPRSLK